MSDFKFSVKLKGKTIKFRKWKVKDKNKFINNRNNTLLIKEALVYDCLEDKKLNLSDEEYKYLLFNIRQQSLNDVIKYSFECDKCKTEYEYIADLSKIMKPTFKKFTDIQEDCHLFAIDDIRNQKFYDEKMLNKNTEGKYLADFILHVKEYNDQPVSFDDMIDIIDNMDIDVFVDVFKKWDDMRFKVDSVHDVECPNCKNKEMIEFDDFPNFFPESWDV